MEKRRIPALTFAIGVFALIMGGLLYVHYGLQRQSVIAEVEAIPASPIPGYADPD